MTPASFQRARNPEQKNERRSALLMTAARLLSDQNDVAGLSLNELAREAGMAKSNVYRYFESREAMLLELMQIQWGEWFDEFSQVVSNETNINLAEILHYLARTLAAQPLLCELTTALPTVLEHNVSAKTIHEFKSSSLEYMNHVAEFICSSCDEIKKMDANELLHHLLLTITGLWPHSHPSSAVKEALQDPALAAFSHNFEVDLERSLVVYARGLKSFQVD